MWWDSDELDPDAAEAGEEEEEEEEGGHEALKAGHAPANVAAAPANVVAVDAAEVLRFAREASDEKEPFDEIDPEDGLSTSDVGEDLGDMGDMGAGMGGRAATPDSEPTQAVQGACAHAKQCVCTRCAAVILRAYCDAAACARDAQPRVHTAGAGVAAWGHGVQDVGATRYTVCRAESGGSVQEVGVVVTQHTVCRAEVADNARKHPQVPERAGGGGSGGSGGGRTRERLAP
eukprot:3362343-Rhodomonas_salina.1